MRSPHLAKLVGSQVSVIGGVPSPSWIFMEIQGLKQYLPDREDSGLQSIVLLGSLDCPSLYVSLKSRAHLLRGCTWVQECLPRLFPHTRGRACPAVPGFSLWGSAISPESCRSQHCLLVEEPACLSTFSKLGNIFFLPLFLSLGTFFQSLPFWRHSAWLLLGVRES